MNERELARCLAALPELEPPPAIRDRWHATLAELPRPIASAGPAQRGRRARRRFARSALAAVAAGAAALVLVLPSAGSSQTDPPARTPPTSALGAHDPTRLGELDDPARLRACLSLRAGPHPVLLAARRISRQGVPAVQLVLGSTTLGRLRILTVTPDCATLLSDTTRGR